MKNIIWCFAMAVLMSNVDAAAPNPVGPAVDQPAQEVVLTQYNWQQFARLQDGVLTISAQVTEIGEKCFTGNKQIQVVIFEPGSRLHTIERAAFMYTHLIYIQLPDSLRNIGDLAFHTGNPCTIDSGPNSQIKSLHKEAIIAPSIIIVRSDQVENSISLANMERVLTASDPRLAASPPTIVKL